MTTKNSFDFKYKVLVAGVVVLVLLFVPAPLLPPHRLAEAIQYILGISWKAAYLVASIGLQTVFYCSIGVISAFLVKRASTFRGRLLQVIVMPVVIVLTALIIRSVKMSHFPVWINAAIPIAASVFGAWLGLGFLYQRGKKILFLLFVLIGFTFWFLTGGPSAELSAATEYHLKKLVNSYSTLPSGEARFGALLKVAFEQPEEYKKMSSVQNNRAALLALGIALGDERLARFVGLKRHSKLIQQSALLRKGTTLRGRTDWPRHFFLSAALATLENPLVSDAGGLMKEQLDALTRGSGFSFCDFAADRAGVRFAKAATNSEPDAKAMQTLMMKEFLVSNFFPPVADFPENLTVEQFRNEFGSVGSQPYREMIHEIESRLDSCIALSPLQSR